MTAAPGVEAIGATMLAVRLAARAVGPSWTLVLVADADQPARCAQLVADELDGMLDPEVPVVVRTDEDLEAALRSAPTAVLLWAPVELDAQRLERGRSRLAHAQPVVAFLRESAARQLSSHMRSWIGASIMRWQDAPDVEVVRTARLAELRACYGRSDDDVVRLAESGELPADPHFAEWLVLLGRGSLVGGATS